MVTVSQADKGNRFHLISGNRLEALAADIAGRLSVAGERGPLEPETVIVQSRGMERWLCLKLAEINGIAANIQFPFPRKFVSELVFHPLLRGGGENMLSPDVYAWKIFEALPKLTGDRDFAALRDYIDNDTNGVKTFQLSRKIAGLFEQYLIARPDVVAEWGRGHNPLGSIRQSAWQWKLWRRLVDESGNRHFATLYREFQRQAYPEHFGGDAGKADFSKLHSLKRIFLFGFSSVSPAFLDIFLGAAKFVEVYFYYLNPCSEEWQYDLSEKAALRLSFGDKRTMVEKADCRSEFEHELENDQRYSGNPLLASFGGQGREFFGLLGLTDETPEEQFAPEPPTANLLQKIHRDIQFNLKPAGESVESHDRTVQVHACHSPMREVEILLDNLTGMFRRDRTLLPKDVLVLAPDINSYAPYIEAVFGSLEQSDPRWCFFTLTDRGEAGLCPESAALPDILDLCGSRFKAPEVMRILETPAVMAAFGLTPESCQIIRTWLLDARISWGIDGDFRAEDAGCGFDDQSWRSGIDNLLAGFAFGSEPEDAGRVFNARIMPLHCCEGNAAAPLGVLVKFLERLFALRKKLYSPDADRDERFTVNWWEQLLNGVIYDFFVSENTAFADAGNLLREKVSKVLENIHDSGFCAAITPAVMTYELRRDLEFAGGGGFLRGGITFCEARPMRSIPGRVICMLGMDEKSFPRKQKHLSFDLMALRPRFGDRSTRNDDRFLFLESLLSARECFYLSYVGQGIRDNEPLPPSIVVSELLDYLEEVYHVPRHELETRHPLQAFSWKYFAAENRGGLISYSEDNAHAAMALFDPEQQPVFISSEIADAPGELLSLTLDDLCRFLVNPARFFLEKRLRVDPVVREIPELPERELFELNQLEKYKIAGKVLHDHLAEWDTLQTDKFRAELRLRLHAAGAMPPGAWGDSLFENMLTDLLPFAAWVGQLAARPIEPAIRQLELSGGVKLSVRLDDLYQADNGPRQLLFRFSKLKAKDQIRAGLYQLAAAASVDQVETWLIGSDKSGTYSSASTEQARAKLEELSELYLSGINAPLPFFPESSRAYYNEYLNSGDRQKSLQAAAKKWYDSYMFAPEYRDDCFRLCFGADYEFDDNFARTADRLGTILDLNTKLLKSGRKGVENA